MRRSLLQNVEIADGTRSRSLRGCTDAFWRPPHPPSALSALSGIPGVHLASKSRLAINCRRQFSVHKPQVQRRRAPPEQGATIRPRVGPGRAACFGRLCIDDIYCTGSSRRLNAPVTSTSQVSSLAKPAVVLPMSMVGIEISTQMPRQRLWRGRRVWWAVQGKQKTTPHSLKKIRLQTRCRDLCCRRLPASLEIWRL